MKVKIHAFISCDLHSTVSRRRWNFFIHFSGTVWITALSFLKPVLAFVPFAKFGQKQSPLPPMQFVLPLWKLVFRPFQKHLSVIFSRLMGWKANYFYSSCPTYELIQLRVLGSIQEQPCRSHLQGAAYIGHVPGLTVGAQHQFLLLQPWS